MSNFLNSPILPGEKIPEHHHYRLLVLFLVIIIFTIAIGLYWFLNKDKFSFSERENMTDEELIIESLNNSNVRKISAEDDTRIIDSLYRSEVDISKEDEAKIIESLNKSKI